MNRQFNKLSPLFCQRIKYNFASKELLFGNEARNKMLEGCDALANAVQVTLGPNGRNVLIDQAFGGVKITKDGVTVAKAIEFSDRFANMGASLIKSVADKANDQAGDGTTTATVLARAIFREALKKVETGINLSELKKGIDLAVSTMVKEIAQNSIKIQHSSQIKSVATISANGDTEIGELLANLFEKVGHSGVITIGQSKTLHHEIEFVEGLKFDRGYISPYFINNQKNQKVQFDKPLILITEHKITSFKQILKFLEFAM
jgi:chaperonin GroEL